MMQKALSDRIEELRRAYMKRIYAEIRATELQPTRQRRRKHTRPKAAFRWACKRARKTYNEAIHYGYTKAEAQSMAMHAGGML